MCCSTSFNLENPTCQHPQPCHRKISSKPKRGYIKGRLLDQAVILYNHVPFQIGTSLKGKNLLLSGANSFLYEQFLIIWKISFITLSYIPRMLLFLLRMCVACIMGATPMLKGNTQQTLPVSHKKYINIFWLK